MCVKLCLFLFGLSAVSSRHVNFYRKDYVYMDEHDAFYKLHWDVNGVSWSSAFLACDGEGSELFYPQLNDEWKVVKKLMEAAPVMPNVTDIFVGIHDKFGLGEFMTIDGQSVPTPIADNLETPEDHCVVMNVDTGVLTADFCDESNFNIRPFVCKKVEDVTCPTIDKGYRYFKDTKKCYKKNDSPKTWSRAMETCFMEGGILVVATSETEAQILSNLIDDDSYYAGFKRIFSHEQFYTVTGHKLQDSGFERWYSHDSKQYECGLLSKYDNQLYFNAVGCDNKLPFICQMDVVA